MVVDGYLRRGDPLLLEIEAFLIQVEASLAEVEVLRFELELLLFEVKAALSFAATYAFVDVAQRVPRAVGTPPHLTVAPSPSLVGIWLNFVSTNEYDLINGFVPLIPRSTRPSFVVRRSSALPLASVDPSHRTCLPPPRISRHRHTTKTKAATSPRRSPSSARLPSTFLEVGTRMEGVAQAPPRAFLPPHIASLSLSCALHLASSVCCVARIASRGVDWRRGELSRRR